MKKIFFMVVCLLSLTACKSSNNEAIIGEWSMSEKKFGVQMVYYYTFNENNSFIYNVCFYSLYVNDNPCDSGEAEWKGTYKIKDNIIYLTVKEEKQIKPNTIAGIPAEGAQCAPFLFVYKGL